MAVADEATVWLRGFIDAHPGSFANIPALRLLDPFDNFAYWEKTINALEEKHKTAPNVVLLRDLVEQERPMCKGQLAPEIALNDVNGKPMKLSDTRGKIVLIDFWASWCGPCRQESPNMVKLYNTYKNKNFTILSVSLDEDPAKWKEAIQRDGLVWKTHVSDLRGWKSGMPQLYGFDGIPFTVLVNPEGKIIAKGLRGAALVQKIESFYTTNQ